MMQSAVMLHQDDKQRMRVILFNTLSSSIAFCIAVNKYQAQVDKYHDDRKWSWLPFHFKRRSGLESGVASFFGVIFIAKSSGLCRKRINKDEFKL
ncbi:hypothetical protein AB182_18360 [Phytobacter ursingii]|uniref:Uncharacterized protein n=1 Tax=Phytobacter ursingii TaxID=1972431 RepID=A0AAC8QQK8_9ENTR|nr:hypothetical protein AB182_18360 [Phytobacter ursingii]